MDKKYPSAKAALEDPEIFCSSALAMAMDKLGLGLVNWEPETLEAEIAALGVDPGQDLMDRLHCAATLLSTNQFNVDFGAFCAMCATLNRSRPSFERLDPPSLDEVAWACAESRLLLGPEEFDSRAFSEPVAAYVGQLLSDAGVTRPPDMLKFALMDEKEADLRDVALSRDEFLFKSYWDSRKQLVDDMEDGVRKTAMELSGQLRRLPLENGDPDFINSLPGPS